MKTAFSNYNSQLSFSTNHPVNPSIFRDPRNIFLTTKTIQASNYQANSDTEDDQSLRTQSSDIQFKKDIEDLFEEEKEVEPKSFERLPLRINLESKERQGEPVVLISYPEGRAFYDWKENSPTLESDFFKWRGLTHPSTYFLAEFPQLYQAQKVLFQRLVARQGLDWSIFAQTFLSLAFFIGVASENYNPVSTHLLQPFLFRPATNDFILRRSIPLGEIVATLCCNAHYAGFEILLYGISEQGGTAYTYDSTIELPRSTYLVHTDILILALSFLVEIGILSLDVGYYTCSDDPWAIQSDLSTTYAEKVASLRLLETRPATDVLIDRTFYFELLPSYEEPAWYSLLAVTYADLNSTCTYNPLQNIYENREATFNYRPNRPFYCPAVSRTPI